jgi:PAS domain S-box-containing protein
MKPYDDLVRENEVLQCRLEEVQDILTAIRTGSVDALVVDGPSGEQVYTLESADHPYRLFVETMNEGAVTLRGDGIISYCNQRAGDLLGKPLEQIFGSYFSEFVASGDRSTIERLLKQADVSGVRGEVLLGGSTSESIPVQVSARRLTKLDGTSLCLVITDLRSQKLQQALQESEDRLRVLAGQLEERVEQRTRDLVASRQHLLALTAELDRTERRLCSRLATELHDYLAQLLVLGRIKIGSARSRWTGADPLVANVITEVDDIFAKSIAYTRTLMAELSPPVLQLGLPAALRWLGEQMANHGLTVDFHTAQDDLPLPDDHVMLLYQSVRELLINVIKHAKTSRATLSIGFEGTDVLTIVVQDDGRGFDPNSLQTNAASEHFGIFSVRERMEALAGWCRTESAPGKGTTITLGLPLRLAVELLPNDIGARTCPAPLPLIEKNSIVHRVLLVEDHAMVRQGLRAILDTFEDVTVVGEASNGEEAVSVVSETRPDVILMDINMPKMDGIEATRRITAAYPAGVVIGVSVNDSQPMIDAMKKAGAAGFVTKDAAAEQLHHTITTLTRAATRSACVSPN